MFGLLKMAERIATALESMAETNKKSVALSEMHYNRVAQMDAWAKAFYHHSVTRDAWMIFADDKGVHTRPLTAEELQDRFRVSDEFDAIRKRHYDEKWEREKLEKGTK